jgi:hypothetical protein
MSHVGGQELQNRVWMKMLMEIWHLRLKPQSLLNGVSPLYRILFWNSFDQKPFAGCLSGRNLWEESIVSALLLTQRKMWICHFYVII